jgi:hypothetical protein
VSGGEERERKRGSESDTERERKRLLVWLPCMSASGADGGRSRAHASSLAAQVAAGTEQRGSARNPLAEAAAHIAP